VSGQLALAAGLTVAAVLIALAAALVIRRMVISRRGGIVECALRHDGKSQWRQGLAEYRGGQLYWHRSLSLRLRPHAAFDRSQLAVLRSRPADHGEAVRLGPGMVIVQCQGLLRHRGRAAERRNVELAMSQAALTGLLSWLEASPIYPIWRASLRVRASAYGSPDRQIGYNRAHMLRNQAEMR
jgi:hypothetical protein